MLRKTLLASCLALGFVAAPTVGDACGGCFIPVSVTSTTGNKTVQVVTDHRMVLALSSAQTTLWDQIRYAGEAGAFIWVLPIPRGVPVRMGLGDNAFINAVAEASARRITGNFDVVCGWNGVPTAWPRGSAGASDGGVGWGGWAGGWGGGGGGCGGSPAPSSLEYTPGSSGSGNGGAGSAYTGSENLSVVGARDTVGPYAAEVVRGGDGTFQRWAAENGYDIPRETVRAVQWYESLGTDFLVLRLAPEAGVDQMQPVRITFPGYVPTLPLRMIAAGIADKVGLDLMVIARGAMQVEGFANEEISPLDLVWDIGAQRSNYRALFSRALARTRGRAWVTEATVALDAPTMSMRGPTGPEPTDLDGGLIEVLAGASDAGTPHINQDLLLQPGRVPMEDTRADPYVDRRIAFHDLGPRATLTRLRTELDVNALDQDLRLAPAGMYFTVPRDLVASRATNLPACPAPAVVTPPPRSSRGGSCGVSQRRGAGPALLLVAFGALLARRTRRRSAR